MESSLYESVLSNTPDTWCEMCGSSVVELFELDEDDEEYTEVASKLSGIEPTSIERVQNTYLWGFYLLKKDEYISRRGSVEERDLWHATGAGKVSSIIQTNFDWRLTKRNLYGKGVSFSPDALYANQYCNEKNGSRRALILCKVLIGNTCIGKRSMAVPGTMYDTSIRKNKKVFVKYNDNEFYPAYVAWYNHKR